MAAKMTPDLLSDLLSDDPPLQTAFQTVKKPDNKSDTFRHKLKNMINISELHCLNFCLKLSDCFSTVSLSDTPQTLVWGVRQTARQNDQTNDQTVWWWWVPKQKALVGNAGRLTLRRGRAATSSEGAGLCVSASFG